MLLCVAKKIRRLILPQLPFLFFFLYTHKKVISTNPLQPRQSRALMPAHKRYEGGRVHTRTFLQSRCGCHVSTREWTLRSAKAPLQTTLSPACPLGMTYSDEWV